MTKQKKGVGNYALALKHSRFLFPFPIKTTALYILYILHTDYSNPESERERISNKERFQEQHNSSLSFTFLIPCPNFHLRNLILEDGYVLIYLVTLYFSKKSSYFLISFFFSDQIWFMGKNFPSYVFHESFSFKLKKISCLAVFIYGG